jgi:hypothetical protein
MHQELDGGVLLTTKFQAHEGKMYVHRKDVSEPLIYEQNKRLRAEDSNKDVRLALVLSQSDLVELAAQYPIHSGSADERRRAWEQIARDKPHLVAKEFRSKFLKGSNKA